MDEERDCSMVKSGGKVRKEGQISTASGKFFDSAGAVAITSLSGNYRGWGFNGIVLTDTYKTAYEL